MNANQDGLELPSASAAFASRKKGLHLIRKKTKKDITKEKIALKDATKNSIVCQWIAATILRNPYVATFGCSEYDEKWKVITSYLVEKKLVENTPDARQKVHRKVSEFLTEFKTFYIDKRAGDEPDAQNELDKLLCELYKPKVSGPVASKKHLDREASMAKRMRATLGRNTGQILKKWSYSEDEDDDVDKQPFLEQKGLREIAGKEHGNVGRLSALVYGAENGTLFLVCSFLICAKFAKNACEV